MKANTHSRPRFQKASALRFGLTVGVGLLLVGCGQHYWNKPGAAASDFNRDSAECARENAVQMTANKDYGIVIADLYKMCLKSRGWNRGQQLEPVPAGWWIVMWMPRSLAAAIAARVSSTSRAMVLTAQPRGRYQAAGSAVLAAWASAVKPS